VVLRARVGAHRLGDQVVDGAVKVVGHLRERLPQDVPAVEMAHRLLGLIHPDFSRSTDDLGWPSGRKTRPPTRRRENCTPPVAIARVRAAFKPRYPIRCYPPRLAASSFARSPRVGSFFLGSPPQYPSSRPLSPE